MKKAVVGRFFETFDAAREYFDMMPEVLQERNCIIEFDEGFLILSQRQAETWRC